MSKLLISIFHGLQKRKFVFYGIVILLFVMGIYFASRIKLEEDITGFMPETPQTERTNFIIKNVSTNDKIIVKLSVSDSTVPDPQDFLTAWADSLANSLNKDPGKDHISDILYRIDDSRIADTYEFVLQNLPLYLHENDYRRLDSLLGREGIRSLLERARMDLLSPMGLVYKKFLAADPLQVSNRVFADLRKSQVDSLYNVYNGYIFSKDNRNLLMFITSAYGVGETGKNEALAKALEYNEKKINRESNGKVVITSFGAPVVGVTNASQIKKDSYVSSIISVILIVILLGIFFKSKRSLFLILLPVAFGAIFSLSILVFIKGTISAIAIGAGSAILGIAINYTLHFLVHYKHCGSVEQTIRDLVSPLVVGSLTTIGAFLSLMFVSAEALRDFGILAALTLFGTLVFVLVLMPHLVPSPGSSSSKYPAFFDRISEVRFSNNKWIILGIVILTLVFGFFSSRLTFESDMNKISYMTPGQKKAFDELSGFTNLSKRSIFHVSEGADVNGAIRNYETAKLKIDSLLQIKEINSVSGVGDMLLSDSVQLRKIERWNRYWKDKQSVTREMFENEGMKLGFRANSFEPFLRSFNKKLQVVSAGEMEQKAGFISGFIISRPDRTYIITLLYVAPLHEERVKKVLGFQPGTFVFDRASMTRETIGLLSKDFNFVLLVCALLVLVFLTLSFGRIELSLLTFIPMVVGWIWILGLMAILHLKFNIVNIILATFIFGLGDDYSIFIMEGSMYEHAHRRKILASYKLAIILSALTMLIGIGSLIFARHPAMKSLAQVTIIGMVSVVVVSYTIVPFFYRWLTCKKGKKRSMPITARNLFNTIYSFTAFLIGSMILSLIGLFLFKITRPDDRKKLFFHKCLAFTAGFVVQRLPDVKTSVVNHNKEDFSRPSVIICNHQSHIDLMLIMMLSPRIVILTNDWVWNSPFYGSIVKYADFYPTSNGIENNIDPLSRLVEKGYSIMIFPEGTRSPDCTINRFHRGAFFLAEQLKLDILPVIIHGMGHVLPKSDLLIRKGAVRVEIMDRITPDTKEYGETYQMRAKLVRRMYGDHYQQMISEIETPGYYADKLYHNYIYKGSSVITLVGADLRKHGNYTGIIDLLPDTGRVLVLGSGIGTFPLLLNMVKPSLVIEAIEEDDDKLSLAGNCVSRRENLACILENPLDFGFRQEYDAVVMVDYFSTLDQESKQKVIKKCIDHSPLVLLSDISYSPWNRLRLKLAGNQLQRMVRYEAADLGKLIEGSAVHLAVKETVMVISGIE